MNNQASGVSPIRAVILNVASMDTARRFYEDALGMECLDDVHTLDSALRGLWGVGEGDVKLVSMGLRQDPYARVELLSWEGCTGQPLRDQKNVFDYGILTLNLRTPDIDKALTHLESCGATVISRPVKYPYQANIFLYEAMVIGPNQERYTLLQIGEPQPVKTHVIGDVIATTGTVVPDSADAQRFYSDLLGLSKAFEMDEPGELFAPLLGTSADFRMRMTLYTAGDCWTGKLETIEFTQESAEFAPLPIQTEWRRAGYMMLSLEANQPQQLLDMLEQKEYPVEKAAEKIDRPFFGPCQMMMTVAPGGVPIEFISKPEA